MKVGDRIYCIKGANDTHKAPVYIKGYIYDILDVKSDEVMLSNSNTSYPGYSFFVLSKDMEYEHYSFYTYFITMKEHRKRKIETLNEKR